MDSNTSNPPIHEQIEDTSPGETRAYGRNDRAVLRISMVYMVTGFVTFLAMGLLGLLMRLDHAGWYVMSPDWFYRVLTIHGTGMVGGLLLAAMGGMSAALTQTVKLSARWLWAAYVVYMLSLPFLLYSVLIGGYAGGWTALDPLPLHGLTWSTWAGVLMYVTFLSVALGFAIYSVHVLVTLIRKYGGVGGALAWRYLFRGQTDSNRQIPTPVEMGGAAISVVGLAILLAGAAVLIPIFAKAAGLIAHVNPLYSKNILMLFGHSVANITMYTSVALVYALLPIITGRTIHTSRLIALAWNLTIVLVLAPIPHHLYQDFAQPFGLHVWGQVMSFAIAPEVLLITILASLAHIYRSGMRWNVPAILIALGFWGWVFGGAAAMIDASVAVNNLTHNTLWVPGHFHSYYLLGAATFVWGYLFYLISDLSGVREWVSSRIAAWSYGVGGVGFLLMFYFSAADGIPRRYAVHLGGWHIYAQIAVPFVLVIIASLLWLIADMARGFGGAWSQIRSSPAVKAEG